jgi:gamma-glutamyltranspeptidase
MAKLIAEEMRLNGGYITKRDLEQYRTVVDDEPPTNTHFHPKWAMCGPRPPSGFAITQLIVAVMAKLHPPGKNQPREG